MLKITFVSEKDSQIKSDLYLSRKDIQFISDDTGYVSENGEQKLMRNLRIVMKYNHQVPRPKFAKNGQPMVKANGDPILQKVEEPVTYIIRDLEEIEKVLAQLV